MADETDNHPADDSGKKESRKKRLGKRITTWSGSLIGAAVIAFVTSYFTVLGNHAASAAPEKPAGQPVQVTVGNVNGLADDASRVLPKPARLSTKALKRLNAAAANVASPVYQEWFSDRGAAFTKSIDIQLVVQGNRHHLVRIINITPAEKCTAPLRGTLFFNPPQGADSSAKLFFNLDKPQRPASYKREGSPRIFPDYFGQYSVSLDYGDQFTFQVIATTQRQSCQFSLNLTVVDNGKVMAESVNDHGRPFRVTAYLKGEHDSSDIRFRGYPYLYIGSEYAPLQSPPADTSGGGPWLRGDPRTFKW